MEEAGEVEEVAVESPNSLLADARAMGDADMQAMADAGVQETADEPSDAPFAELEPSLAEEPVAPPDDFRFPFARAEPVESIETGMDEQVASIPLVDEPPAPRRGFFSRLFSRRPAEPRDEEEVPPVEEVPVVEEPPFADYAASSRDMGIDSAAAHAETIDELDVVRDEPVEPEIPAFLHEPPRHSRPLPAIESPVDDDFDRPNLDDPAFFIPEDVEPMVSRDVPSLDDALPAAEASDSAEPADAWDAADDEAPVAEPKPGFFSRLIKRLSRPVRQVEAAEPETAPDDAGLAYEGAGDVVSAEESLTQADEALAAADDFFVVDATQADQRFAPPTFETIDEALPAPVVPMPTAAPPPAPVASQADDFLFGDTIDPMDVVPAVGSPTMEEIVDARPTVETTPQRDTVRADILDEESTDEFVQPVPPEVDAAAEAERPPFFVPKFRSFYNEIVLYKHQKSQFTGGFATAIVDYTADLSPDAAAQGLSKRLQEILELQHAEAQWMGGEAAARYPDAQYAMAVLADELFTHMEWPGQAAWPKYLLELRMFRTHAADVEFFKRVDRLLKNEADNPSRAARDLARLYLLVLASGFRGKYRQPNLVRPLAEYRRRLYEFIYDGDSLMLYAADRRLFPEATQRTLESRAVARFSGLQQWAAALIVILVGYTLLANMAWKRVSADLTDVTARVEAASRTTSSDGSWGSAREDSLR